MNVDEQLRHLLHDIALRSDHVGHVLLQPEEIEFARSELGRRYFEEVDAAKRLYRLTYAARQDAGL